MEGEESEYQAILSFWAVRRAHDGPGPAWDGDGDLGGAPQLLGWSCLLEQAQRGTYQRPTRKGLPRGAARALATAYGRNLPAPSLGNDL